MSSRYPNGFKNGFNIRNIPMVQTHPGKVFWVYNGTVSSTLWNQGSDSINAGDFAHPYKTLGYALTQVKPNEGDIIFIRPGHAENVPNATQILLSACDGVAVVGLGVGSARPTFTFTTATTANIPVTSTNVSLQNLRFVANFANIASFFTATGTATPTDFSIEDCEFKDTSSILNALTVVTGNATANSMDGFRFVNNRISSLGTTAATTAIKIAAAVDRMMLLDNYGNWAVLNDTACFLAASANNITNFDMGRNRLQKPNTSSTGGSFVSTSGSSWTGHAYDNYMYQLDNTAGIWIATGTGLGFSQNFSPITGAADKSALINPAAV